MKTLVLCPTDSCQLSCDFCLCLESLNKGNNTSLEDMIRFIDWQFNLYPNEDFNIEFFGAEPTLAWDKIKTVQSYISNTYKDVNVSYTLFTNGLFNKEIDREFEIFANSFDEIIISLEGDWNTSKRRHPKESSHKKVVENIKKLIPYQNIGIAFVVFPDTDLESVYNYFNSMGLRYFNFEIVTHINNDKDSGVTNKDIFKVCEFIYENILLFNVSNPEEYKLFTIPRELLSSYNYFRRSSHKSCLDSVRALSPKGNVYFCRDMVANEDKLLKQSDDKSIFRSSQIVPFNIKDFTLDKNSDSFKEEIREYDKYISCPLKSYEHYHFIGGSMPWIKDKDFQDLVIYPLFSLSWDFFEGHRKSLFKDEHYLAHIKKKIELYGKVIQGLKPLYT